ncbi:hypothetical protein [Desulfoglaeba alkanexedens]|uniref:Uncharacterized protein n=1 Tax=Desulfoglaeba alkanexedens ALDC TaxID=980445 RepID=A0A4P8L387_9BACT|nr:hypothetical protein [Desulfoglaeba alkanexedens]QCQ22310.1 hypothetical protein FDQ92_09135 [Desulfoglaeba alkanexedens ALDC]
MTFVNLFAQDLPFRTHISLVVPANSCVFQQWLNVGVTESKTKKKHGGGGPQRLDSLMGAVSQETEEDIEVKRDQAASVKG